jgi:hypothetical protein
MTCYKMYFAHCNFVCEIHMACCLLSNLYTRLLLLKMIILLCDCFSGCFTKIGTKSMQKMTTRNWKLRLFLLWTHWNDNLLMSDITNSICLTLQISCLSNLMPYLHHTSKDDLQIFYLEFSKMPQCPLLLERYISMQICNCVELDTITMTSVVNLLLWAHPQDMRFLACWDVSTCAYTYWP